MINATPQTKSWFAKNSRLIADGMPSVKPVMQTPRIAWRRAIPKSTRTRVDNSIIAMRELKAANDSPRKNSMAKTFPAGIFANSCGIQMNVSPVAAGPLVFMISSTSALLISAPRTANTVPNMTIAARSETVLLPTPVMSAFLTMPWRRCM